MKFGAAIVSPCPKNKFSAVLNREGLDGGVYILKHHGSGGRSKFSTSHFRKREDGSTKSCVANETRATRKMRYALRTADVLMTGQE